MGMNSAPVTEYHLTSWVNSIRTSPEIGKVARSSRLEA